MAVTSKKGQEVLRGKDKLSTLPGFNEKNTTHTHTSTHTPIIKETKTRRVQLLTYGSLVDQMDEYGKLNGLSRAEVFELAIKEFLENK